ncbi:low temperature requirement protein A [Frondihabitans cladoniiphilus]|uniref:Low temperature requirement protein A n=1 Tax=Frondihabitans cladoniiphilus TaxID=715785 RepID=A0ABP8VSZ1_9MICO
MARSPRPLAQHRSALRLMTMRDPNEPHRAASSLELLFDLTIVVGVSFSSTALHHNLTEGHGAISVVYFAMGFFGLWLAWLNFTWFATSFDTDDWLYRIATIVQMGGALTYAAGLPKLEDVEHPDFTLGVTGYVIMRLPMAFQWFRAAVSDPRYRRTTLTYGFGILIAQVFWTSLLFVPTSLAVPTFGVGIVLEMLVPIVAERRVQTQWHRHHVTERYGLFTLIVLGESILASTNAVVAAGSHTDHLPSLVLLAASSLVIIAAFWWIYFAFPQHNLLGSAGMAFTWGYGHYVIFASAAALAAGIEIAIDTGEGEGGSHLSTIASSAALAVPCAVFVLFVWLFVLRRVSSRRVNTVVPVFVVLIALASFAPFALQVVAGLLVIVVVVVVSGADRSSSPSSSSSSSPGSGSGLVDA